jgi:hypothetical protein
VDRYASLRGAALASICISAAGGCAPGSGDLLGPSINHAPIVRSVTTVPERVTVGGTAVVRVDAVDPDGDQLFYRYSAESGSVTVPDAANPNQAVYVQNGAARDADRITVTVTDTRNASATLTAVVPLLGNRPPAVTIEWVKTGPGNKDSCHPDCTLTARAVASDPDGDPLTYVWSGCASGTEVTAQCSVLAPGVVSAVVVVSDGHGGVTAVSADALGTDADPIVTGGRVIQGPQAQLSAQFSDPDGDPLTCGWSGDCTCTGQASTFNLSCDVPAGAGSCSMLFQCTDVFGASGQTRFTVLS